MSWTAPLTWTVGQVVTAAQLNQQIRDNEIFLGNPAIFSGSQVAVQSIPNNVSTYTAINLDTEQVDSVNGHSTTTNPSRYVIQSGWAGYYFVTGHVVFAANATNRRGAAIGVNGTYQPLSQSVVGAASATGGIAVVATFLSPFMNVGDYFEVLGYQDSGVALNTVANYCCLQLQFMHQ